MSAHATPRLSLPQARDVVAMLRGDGPYDPGVVADAADLIDRSLEVARLIKAARQGGFAKSPHPRQVEKWLDLLRPGERITFAGGHMLIVADDGPVAG